MSSSGSNEYAVELLSVSLQQVNQRRIDRNEKSLRLAARVFSYSSRNDMVAMKIQLGEQSETAP
jgi:hypothetical protein